jgi:hypothetical protein
MMGEKEQMTTIVVLTYILNNFRKAITDHPENYASILQQTIEAIQDNSHNIAKRDTPTPPQPIKKGTTYD